MALTTLQEFREFATKREVGSDRNQKQSCKAHQKLSIDVNFIKLNLKFKVKT